ncbi:sodium/potassium/calcium exchanger Nckx30C isoform X4 [Vanessa tameamea]|uniref:Sodium/potassium/calcium exchanger Nckx30C isoform X4 n=1 Tax=Vanessa tameamea TaxID=334116 RepID=A0A8B8IA50_VANTA|nr:sodium/potassium/calcium exchanger Nckx30C isoform X4 [Vanessa tameamea]XP_047536079.1 sodium/potassium/calcium exchanger Nckx30C isoform X4 [Vanessa atalanta]
MGGALLLALLAAARAGEPNATDLTATDFTDLTAPDPDLEERTPLFPEDLFTEEERRSGAIVFHVIGMGYMFVALAIVCDEFFVPALDVIIERLAIRDDVAGATFMAAGGSAPELFTSIIGVFVSFDDVGIGTIVGSAVFNILFVIGACALFSRTTLSLTWWPLFRDCTFYSISLLVLIYCFRDNVIYWQEALVLFSLYGAYVLFMRWNQQVERAVKKLIYKNKHGNATTSSETSVGTNTATVTATPGPSKAPPPAAKFRHGLLQLMIHTIDPMHDGELGKVDEKATQLHAIASLKVLLEATRPTAGGAGAAAARHSAAAAQAKETPLDLPNGGLADVQLDAIEEIGDLEDDTMPLDMSWPSGFRKRITYLLVAPIVFPLWMTLPDTRTPRGKKLFPVTFIGSIVWIAFFSYLMVWWANLVGAAAYVPPEVMGLTLLAAGTSVPDLITSVIVARKGFGDMAVSSSVGSNIFDVTVGLPLPWLLYGLIYGEPVQVNSKGMVCSIVLLFAMLIFVIISIACFRWKMNRGLGFTMFLLYFVFVAVSLGLEYGYLHCPSE